MSRWLGESPYNCPSCGGDGDSICDCCGSETECEECDGTGWDSEQIDIDAFKAACDELREKVIASGRQVGTYEWIEGGVRLGRSAGDLGGVRASDFIFQPAN